MLLQRTILWLPVFPFPGLKRFERQILIPLTGYLHQNVFYDLTVDVGQCHVPAAEAEDQLFVVHSELLETVACTAWIEVGFSTTEFPNSSVFP